MCLIMNICTLTSAYTYIQHSICLLNKDAKSLSSDCLKHYIPAIEPHSVGQLSLASLRGRLIEYQLRLG